MPGGISLAFECADIANIINDIVGTRGIFGVWDLVRQSATRVCLCRLASWAIRPQPRYIAGNLQLVGCGDHHDAVNAPPPVGEHAFLLTPRARIALRLKDQ